MGIDPDCSVTADGAGPPRKGVRIVGQRQLYIEERQLRLRRQLPSTGLSAFGVLYRVGLGFGRLLSHGGLPSATCPTRPSAPLRRYEGGGTLRRPNTRPRHAGSRSCVASRPPGPRPAAVRRARPPC